MPKKAYTFPSVDDLPPGWVKSQKDPFHCAYENKKRKLRVLISAFNPHGRPDAWVHVSYSHPNRVPSHETTVMVKDLFIGENRESISILPPKERYVDIMKTCLHLWSPLSRAGRTWPQFESHIDGIGWSI